MMLAGMENAGVDLKKECQKFDNSFLIRKSFIFISSLSVAFFRLSVIIRMMIQTQVLGWRREKLSKTSPLCIEEF